MLNAFDRMTLRGDWVNDMTDIIPILFVGLVYCQLMIYLGYEYITGKSES